MSSLVPCEVSYNFHAESKSQLGGDSFLSFVPPVTGPTMSTKMLPVYPSLVAIQFVQVIGPPGSKINGNHTPNPDGIIPFSFTLAGLHQTLYKTTANF